ncbi:MAG: hypothetical protein JXR96_15700 [Deltaproteobacteria bacterium]|nr:hypothetical protein [Deltaproteobacteria bacterium]
MLRPRSACMLALCGLAVLACSGSSASIDASVEDGSAIDADGAGGDRLDGAGDGGGDAAVEDGSAIDADGAGGDGVACGEEDFLLEIPAGTGLCAMLNSGDVREVHARKARALLAAGTHCLPSSGTGDFEADWIERIVTQQGEAQATGPGQVHRSVEQTARGQAAVFAYEQRFDLPGERGWTLQVRLEYLEGVRALALDEQALTTGFDFSAQGSPEEAAYGDGYMSCEYSLLHAIGVEIETLEGDALHLQLRAMNPPCPPGMACAGGVFWLALTGAEWSRAEQSRSQDDYFETGATAFHHFGGKSYLVLFDEPAGEVCGLWLPRDEMGGEPVELRYLDASGEVSEVHAISRLEEVWP